MAYQIFVQGGVHIDQQAAWHNRVGARQETSQRNLKQSVKMSNDEKG